ncbi:glutamine amidotransferase class-II [Methanococcus aeolicus Nankai-3]|uniref:Glutamine amidotransferase class-II n=1 Tax=Methanococcus aeolicus (strain ATCC BAA-1280 / DSM 17508 / OCM 812 / Nankai-3) TaxID=419665 RepID=A6UWK4_META3|nr:glutamine amidotransferase family protein [Methanococcus aeolicus]ABR56876.1 glutamine amidotransferase class-II [Methanococcus aeolicus Nankai-3]
MCGIIGFISRDKKLIRGDKIAIALDSLKERGNGQGSGYVGYGIYPKYKDSYAIHVFLDNNPQYMDIKENVKQVLEKYGYVLNDEEIPTKDGIIEKEFIPWRFFYDFDEKYADSEKDLMVDMVMEINDKIDGAFVFSSGKNMGIFKASAWPMEVAEFYKLDEYEGYMWLSHARYPTNTRGWWGGAHPFNLLNWSVVHNGEITSYGTNKRYVESFGYKCRLLTDTEVVAYIFDLLIRKHEIPVEYALSAVAPKFWKEIDTMEDEERELHESIRMTYGGATLNGPFAIIVGTEEGMMFMNGETNDGNSLIGITDRIKLRPLIVGEKDDLLFVSSEEAAIRKICPELDKVWMPDAGEPVLARINK